jgi:hypothetical protein
MRRIYQQMREIHGYLFIEKFHHKNQFNNILDVTLMNKRKIRNYNNNLIKKEGIIKFLLNIY